MRVGSIAVALVVALALTGCSDVVSAIKGEKGDPGKKATWDRPGRRRHEESGDLIGSTTTTWRSRSATTRRMDQPGDSHPTPG
jgi:uncharacterized protein YceK